MTREFDERALWLVRTVVPHEAQLRSWLKLRRVVDLDIDDIVQETYAKLLSLDTVEAIRDPKAYAFKTAHSILTSHVRRTRIVSIRATGNIEHLNAEAPYPSPERQLADRDELHVLARAIAAMSEKCRTVFTMRRIEGLGYGEIATRLRISEKAVEMRMSRGLRQLMDALGRGGQPESRSSNSQKRARRVLYGEEPHDPGD